jgi:hypothetical protein
MNTSRHLAAALDVAAWLTEALHELAIPANLRNRVAASCFAVVQEHQQAVLVLLQPEHPLHASAFALVRPTFEAYVRGMWLSHCASDAQVERFCSGAKPPDMASLIAAVEKAGQFTKNLLTVVYKNNWSAFSSYTHTGSHQVQRWNSADAIQPNYTSEEVDEVLRFTAAVALLSGVSMAAMSSNEALGHEALEKVKQYAADVL